MSIIYRPYQREQHDNILREWNSGKKAVASQSATGSGKTVLLSGIIKALDVPTVAIAHRQELVAQMSRTLAANSIEHSVIGSDALIRNINKQHLRMFGRTYYHAGSQMRVASIDTLISKKNIQSARSWGKDTGLWIMDEGHHLLRNNKWGTGVNLLPNALGLGLSAWFGRSDGIGLGDQAGGFYEALVKGPDPGELIDLGYLSAFKMYGPKSNIDLTGLNVTASGDYNQNKLIQRARKSQITGDIVEHYLNLAAGKRGVTFVTDVETADETARKFNEAGVPAVAISANTPDLDRQNAISALECGELLQIINVDILGEGFDCPAIECVSFARPTASYSLFIQQFGRGLRIFEGKEKAIIIDHVGNVERFGGAPLIVRDPMFENREKKSNSKKEDVKKLKTCSECLAYYEAYLTACSECGYEYIPEIRSKPEHVDGDLILLDEYGTAEIEKKIEESKAPPAPSGNIIFDKSNHKKHLEKLKVKEQLKTTIGMWWAHRKIDGFSVQERYRLFYNMFGIDARSAGALDKKHSLELMSRVEKVVSYTAHNCNK